MPGLIHNAAFTRAAFQRGRDEAGTQRVAGEVGGDIRTVGRGLDNKRDRCGRQRWGWGRSAAGEGAKEWARRKPGGRKRILDGGDGVKLFRVRRKDACHQAGAVLVRFAMADRHQISGAPG